MVGVFCLTFTTVVLYMVASTRATDLKKCPEYCTCLGYYVDCSQKGFTGLPSDVPAWTKQLNLNNNHIHNLNKSVLSSLGSLKGLKLNRNKISHLSKDVFKAQKQLKALELNRNLLTEIEALSFQSLEQLSILKLKRNNIKALKDGAFFGLKNINSLELDYNKITGIARVWVYGLDHLSSLSLSDNSITYIEDDVWDLCKKLYELNLSSNFIQNVKEDTFKHLSKLERLNLNNNNISVIEENAFSKLSSLKFLYLNNNKLSWTVEDQNLAFVGLNNLEILHLASNQIKSISMYAFTELVSVVSLDLTNNNVTTIQNNAFGNMINLKNLNMNSTALVCDTNLQWFAEWVRVNNFNDIVVECAYPLLLRGKSILDLPLSNLTYDDIPKPRLIDEPKMKMALKGDNVSLVCKAISSSPSKMTFVWKRDNVALRDAVVEKNTSSTDGHTSEYTSELKLYNVAHSDQGKYQCIVSNSFGTAYSQKARLSVLIFPKFSKIPSNETVQAGATARLQCAAFGEPPPQIAWQKDGGNDFPAARERRMHVMPSDDVFFIINTKIADMGVYSCTAQNPAGKILANATLTILEIPSFVKPMENKEIMSGKSIVLECMASGSPKPSLTWLKDGGPLRATERHFFTAEDQLMIIVDTTLSDAGTYECVMNNSIGTERGMTELHVIPRTPVSDDDMMGIIIITVVCCAVGTSIIWVVIIYQARRRINTTINNSVLADVDTRVFVDNASEHSSCKDSGTGDSAKRSSVGENFTLFPESSSQHLKEVLPGVLPGTQASHVNNSHTPLLQTQDNYSRSTNHDRPTDQSLAAVKNTED